MATLFRWKDSKGNASEPMTLDAAKARDKQEKNYRNPLGFHGRTDYRTFIFPVEVTDAEFSLFAQ